MDDRMLRIAVLLSAHVIFLSAAALRIIRGQRRHLVRSRGPWWLEYYPPLVWIPFIVAYVFPIRAELPEPFRIGGVAIAVAAALFAAWAMWSLGRSYGIRMDLYEGHRLVTTGPYALTRHPMYLGIVIFHYGAALGLDSFLLMIVSVVYVLPFTIARIGAEERVLREGLPGYAAYAARVPSLLPIARP